MTIRPWLGDNIKVCPFSAEPERIGLTTEMHTHHHGDGRKDVTYFISVWSGRLTVQEAREFAAGLLAACDWAENREKAC